MTTSTMSEDLASILARGAAFVRGADERAPTDPDETRRRRIIERKIARFERDVPAYCEGAVFPNPFPRECDGRPRAMLRQGYANVRAPRLLFLGPSGAGKTRLAVAMARARLAADIKRLGERAPVPMFVDARELSFARIQHAAGEGEPELVERAIAAGLAILDDVGSETKTQGCATRDIIAQRHKLGRPTWITTWLDPDDKEHNFTTAYDGGIERRVLEEMTIIRCSRAS